MNSGLKKLLPGIALFFIGMLIGPALIIALIRSGATDKTRFIVPGEVTIEITKTGTYCLWNDFETIYEGRSFNQSDELPHGMEFSVTDAGGKRLEFTSHTGMTKTSGNNESISIGYVEIEDLGPIHIEVSGSSEERIFTFSKGTVMQIILLIMGAVFLSALCLLLGLILSILGIIKISTTPPKNAT